MKKNKEKWTSGVETKTLPRKTMGEKWKEIKKRGQNQGLKYQAQSFVSILQ